jgi:hypothetical protein
MTTQQPQLPKELLSKAYQFNAEYAWKPIDIPLLSDFFKENSFAVLGGEVWIKTDTGPLIPSDLYNWSIERNENENWHEYVSRSLKAMEKFSSQIIADPTLSDQMDRLYINVEFEGNPDSVQNSN